MYSYSKRLHSMFYNTRYYSIRLVVAALLAITMQACEGPGPKTPVAQPEPSANVETKAPVNISDLDQSIYNKAVDSITQEKYKKAEKTLAKLSSKYPKNFAIRTNLALVHFKQENYNVAYNEIQSAIKLQPSSAYVHNLAGLISVEQRKFSDAEKAYTKAIKLDPRHTNAHYNIALLYDIYFQDIAKAYKHYVEYLELAPDDTNTKDWVEQLKYSLDRE